MNQATLISLSHLEKRLLKPQMCTFVKLKRDNNTKFEQFSYFIKN